MKIELHAIGKHGFPFVDEGIKMYQQRIDRYVRFEYFIHPDVKNVASLSESERKKRESKLLLDNIIEGDYIVLLDEKGKLLSSRELSLFVQQRMNAGNKTVKFMIGGAYGFSEDLYLRADQKISLSKLTFPHDLVRLVFIEQLYRSLTIIKGEKYHHD